MGVNSNAGFMAQTVDGVVLGMKSMLEDAERMSALDSKVAPVPWRESLFKPNRKLRIGWYDTDHFFPTVPGCKRALAETLKGLEARGHEVVHFQPSILNRGALKFFAHVLADQGKCSLELWEGEILDQAIETNRVIYSFPIWLRRSFLRTFVSLVSPIFALCSSQGACETAELWRSMSETKEMSYTLSKELDDAGVDVVLAPGHCGPGIVKLNS